MTPTHTQKGSRRYRYYVTRALVERGAASGSSGARRVPAAAIEASILGVLRAEPRLMRWHGREVTSISERQGLAMEGVGSSPDIQSRTLNRDADRLLIDSSVTRITLGFDEITIELRSDAALILEKPMLQVGWSTVSQHRHRTIMEPSPAQHLGTPMRPETRETLVNAICRGHAWLDDLLTGALPDIEAIAKREGRSKRTIHMMLSPAFLAPDVTAAAVAGQLPPGVALRQLVDPPADWVRQSVMIGLA